MVANGRVQDDAQHREVGLMAAAGEAWLFSLADAHIVSMCVPLSLLKSAALGCAAAAAS
jgi:hypothetical protein